MLVTTVPAAAGGLVYVESSSGLENPGMEGGRTEMEFADVDGDGHLDIVSSGDHGSPFINSGQHGLMVWFGDGSGSWSLVQTGDFGYGGVALGDVNGDGFMDAAYGMHHDYSGKDLGDQILEVALGDGTGTSWTPWDDGLATNGETWGMFATDLGDVDEDGDLDVGSISFGCCAGIHVYLNNGDGTWAQSFGFLGGNSSMDFAFGDVDGDGHLDFAASHGNGSVWLGDGTGGFTLADGNLPAPTWRTGVSIGDVNDDGRDDLAFIASGGLDVWTRGADGVWVDLSGSLPASGGFERTQIADMDLDGHGDIVALSEDVVVVYRGDGSGGWSEAATFPTEEACDTAALRAGSDADHNGKPDIVTVTEEDCGIFTGGTNRPRFYAEGSTPQSSSIHPVRPRGGDVLPAGAVRFVEWHAAVPDGAGNPMVEIELSRTGPDGPWAPVAVGLVNNGRYQWSVPADVAVSHDAHLRLTLATEPPAIAVTPGSFTIAGLGDFDGDGSVGTSDLLSLLAAWGPCPGCPQDLDGNGVVSTQDLLLLLTAWG
jgi:hypothetical protein